VRADRDPCLYVSRLLHALEPSRWPAIIQAALVPLSIG
jgi:hypothetical protein